MFRKLVVGGMTLGTAAGILFGTETLSYVKTFGSGVREAVRSEITPEFELNRIQGEVGSLMPEIQEHLKVVAEQSVDTRDMERSIQEKLGLLEKQRLAIMAIRADLESDRDSLTYHGISYTRNEVQADLAQRFEAYQVLEASLERDRQILTAQRTTLRANQQKLDAMLTRKQDLAVKVAQLEARLKQVQAAEAVSRVEIDDSRLAHVEKMIRELDRSLDVRQTMLETEGQLTGSIPVDEPQKPVESHDILSRIDSHFGVAKEKSTSAGEPQPVTAPLPTT